MEPNTYLTVGDGRIDANHIIAVLPNPEGPGTKVLLSGGHEVVLTAAHPTDVMGYIGWTESK